MSDQTARRTEDAIARAVKIARRIARGDDLRVRGKIKAFPTKLRYRKHELCIAKDAWRQVAEADIKIDQLLDDDDAWQGFMNEIFHHALRIAPEGSAAG